MGGLKSRLASDAARVFLREDEFAGLHEVEGRRVTCVLDDPSQGSRDMDVGLPSATYRLFARVNDLPRRKRPGATLVVDGIPYMVESWREDMGMADVALVRAQ